MPTSAGELAERLGLRFDDPALLTEALDAEVGHELGLREEGWRPLWVVDFPMYEWDEERKKVDFSHNPFSMPQGGLDVGEEPAEASLRELQEETGLKPEHVELARGELGEHAGVLVAQSEVDQLALLGARDANLRLLEEKIEGTLTVRGHRMIIEGAVDEVVRNDAAYRLARIHFQKGQMDDALLALDRIDGKIPESIRDDIEFLRANGCDFGQGFLFGRGNQPLSPAVIRNVGLDNIVVVASQEKLVGLPASRLLVDTGDPQLDRDLSGYLPVLVSARRSVMMPVHNTSGEIAS